MPHNQDNAIFTTEDFATAFIRFEGGATLSLTVSWAINGPQDDGLKVTIYGDRGGLTLDPAVIYGSQHHVLTDTSIPVAIEFSYTSNGTPWHVFFVAYVISNGVGLVGYVPVAYWSSQQQSSHQVYTANPVAVMFPKHTEISWNPATEKTTLGGNVGTRKKGS